MRTIKDLASRLCAELVQDVVSRHGRSFVVTAFQYPDGDSLNLYLDGQNVTDGGITRYKFRQEGHRLTPSRERFIERVCTTYGIADHGFAFGRVLDNPAQSCLRLCEAITRISSLLYNFEDHRNTEFQFRLESLLVRRVLPVREWKSNWHDSQIDPKKVFPVDYHFNGTRPPRHLFRVSSPYKAAVVTAVSSLYQARGVSVPTMCVIDPESSLGETHIHRITTAVDEITFGIVEDRIVDFVMAKQ